MAEAGAGRDTGGGKGKRPRREMSREEELSRAMSYILRHGALKEGMPMADDGTIAVDALLAHKRLRGATIDDVRAVVANNDKQRFVLAQDADTGEWRVKAAQGHSMRLAGVQDSLEEMDEVACASYHFVHGTYERHWPAIRAEGLNRMKRDHVHLALVKRDAAADADALTENIDALCRAGIRRGCELLIFVDAPRALAQGCRFFRSANGVGLTDGANGSGVLPAACFLRVVRRSDGAALPL